MTSSYPYMYNKTPNTENRKQEKQITDMLLYNERLYDFLTSKSGLAECITDAEAQSICIALEMYNTSCLNYLSKEEIDNLLCITADKKKMLWKLIKEVKKDRRFAPDLRRTYEGICDILVRYKEVSLYI